MRSQACDAVYETYRAMCRAAKADGDIDENDVLDRIRKSIKLYKQATGQVVNSNGEGA